MQGKMASIQSEHNQIFGKQKIIRYVSDSGLTLAVVFFWNRVSVL